MQYLSIVAMRCAPIIDCCYRLCNIYRLLLYAVHQLSIVAIGYAVFIDYCYMLCTNYRLLLYYYFNSRHSTRFHALYLDQERGFKENTKLLSRSFQCLSRSLCARSLCCCCCCCCYYYCYYYILCDLLYDRHIDVRLF
jgi:hypothetical protein